MPFWFAEATLPPQSGEDRTELVSQFARELVQDEIEQVGLRLELALEEPEIAALRQRILDLQQLADFKPPQAAAAAGAGTDRPDETARLNDLKSGPDPIVQALHTAIDKGTGASSMVK